MKESNQVTKLLIASAVIVLTVPAIASAAPEESESQQTLVGALDAGQATAGKVITLEDFEGGSGREQVVIPAKRADSSTSAAMGQLLREQQLQIDKKLDADREALDKKIEAQLKTAESRGNKITGIQRVAAGYAVRAEDAVAIVDISRVEDTADLNGGPLNHKVDSTP